MFKTIGERISFLRALFGLKQKELAKFLGITQSHYANIEVGKRSLSIEQVFMLQKKFGISAEWLLFGEGTMFTDLEKSFYYLLEKRLYSIEEIYLIFSQIQNIYAIFHEAFTHKEIFSSLLSLVEKYNLLSNQKIEHYKQLTEKYSFGYGWWNDELAAIIGNHIVEKDFKITDSLISDLQEIVRSWGLYVFRSATLYEKYKFYPLESIYVDFSLLKNKQELEGISESFKKLFESVASIEKINLFNYYGHLVLEYQQKGRIEFESDKIFGFIVAVMNIEKRNNRKMQVLDYEFFYTDTGSVHIRQNDITLVFYPEEFINLKECMKRVIENTNLYKYFQLCYIEKYGFV